MCVSVLGKDPVRHELPSALDDGRVSWFIEAWEQGLLRCEAPGVPGRDRNAETGELLVYGASEV